MKSVICILMMLPAIALAGQDRIRMAEYCAEPEAIFEMTTDAGEELIFSGIDKDQHLTTVHKNPVTKTFTVVKTSSDLKLSCVISISVEDESKIGS